MTYESFRYIFIGGAALSAVMLVTSIVLFFAFDVPDLFGYFSGKNKRKGLEEIQRENKRNIDVQGNRSTFDFDGEKTSGKLDNSRDQLQPDAEYKSVTQDLNTDAVLETEYLDSKNDIVNTTLLSEEADKAVFVIEREITFIHTDEVIA